MRTPILSIALAASVLNAFSAEPPRFPESFNVAGAQCDSTGHLRNRLPPRVPDLSGVYDSESITDGRQTLKIQMHADGSGGWLIDGTLTTQYASDAPEVLKFTNMPLHTTDKAAWFETGVPSLTGYSVNYLRPRLARDDQKFEWGPAVLIGDSIYTRKADRASSRIAASQGGKQ